MCCSGCSPKPREAEHRVVTRVLVVDDSAIIRRVLTAALSRAADVEVATAVDPYDARDKVAQFDPHVITLDLEMPRMDGLSFLERLMKYHPVPVIVVSSLAPQRSDAAVHALQLGAVSVIAKPRTQAELPRLADQLLSEVRAAAQIDRAALLSREPGSITTPRPRFGAGQRVAARRLIAIGASTGGPAAIEQILRQLPETAPGVLVVQHMPAGFTAAFARRLDGRSALDVREARDGDVVRSGVALIAPGGRHMVVQRQGSDWSIGLGDGPPVHYQRPAVDVLFHSVAGTAGPDAVGVLLTGMGADGASGMLAMRAAGAHTIAQDEATSVVFSMPREAHRFGGVCELLPLPRIARAILAAAAQSTTRRRAAP
jgi:two-component system, chemotaxis family, protein-glutamate methylesterase/glutaminase